VQFYEDIFPYHSSIPTPTNHASIPHLTTSIFPDPDIPIHNPHITHLILPPHLSIFPHLFILHLPIYSTPQPAPLRKYTRPRIFPACYDDYVCPIIANTTPYLLHSFVTYDKLSSSYKSYVFSIFTHTEPSTYTQACSSLISLGYKQSQSGHSLFIKKDEDCFTAPTTTHLQAAHIKNSPAQGLFFPSSSSLQLV
jgi:hypothetical protein